MKRRLLLLLGMLLLVGTLWAQDCMQIKRSQLPQAARHYVMDNWNNVSITGVYQLIEGYTITYEVRLVDSTRIRFNRDGGWRNVTSAKPIPQSAVPARIYKYVQTNHKGHAISTMTKRSDGYTVTLDEGKTLAFDLEGKLK